MSKSKNSMGFLTLVLLLSLLFISLIPPSTAVADETVTLYMEVNEWNSCLFVFTWDGTSYQIANDIYSVGRGINREYTDYLYMESTIALKDGVYSFEIREVPSEESYTDTVKLMTIDHPARVSVDIDSSGNAHFYSNPNPPDSAVDNNGWEAVSFVGAC